MIWRPTLTPATVSDGRIDPNSQLFKQFHGTWIVTWYGRIGRPRGANTVPPVEIYFHALAENGLVCERRRVSEAPLTLLNVFRIGSVWDGHVCRQSAVLQKEIFDVSFHEGDWKYTTLAGALKAGEVWAREFVSFYPLKYRNDESWLLVFRLDHGRKLIVPCLEFFTTMYGASSELKRILATYPWPEATKRMYSPVDESQFECWAVSPGPRLVSMDGLFLAWFKYDPYACAQAKSIFAQLQAASISRWKFLKVCPWWQGRASLKVEGFHLNGGNDFMALRISGSTFPDEIIALITPERPEREAIGEDGNGHEETLDGKPEIKRLPKQNEKFPLTPDELPDHLAPTEVHDLKSFEVLNDIDGLTVVSSRKGKVTVQRARKLHWKQDDIHSASTDEPYSNGKGVAKAILVIGKKMESEGVLRDMWNALVELKEKSKDILYVGYYDPTTDVFREGNPLLVEVAPTEAVEKSTDSNLRRWPYMNAKDRIFRGFLVAKVVAEGGTAYIIEIQRRVIGTAKTSDNEKSQKEESFKGLVFKLDDEGMIREWVSKFAQMVCVVRGKMDQITSHCPGMAFSFKHCTSKNDSRPCITSALNALRKVGISITYGPPKDGSNKSHAES